MEKIIAIANKSILGGATSPFQREGVALFDWPTWVGYTFGSLLVVIGILIGFYIPRARDNVKAYKREQLSEYNKKYKKNETNYERTGMYLPGSQKFKLFLPLFFAILLIFIGIAWIVGNSLTTL